MDQGGRSKKVLKVLSCIPASALTLPYSAIQVSNSSLQDLLSKAAKADETLLYVEDRELARLLFEKVGNADVAEEAPTIGEEFFYLVSLKKTGGAAGVGQPKIEDVVVYRCVTARGVWL